MCRALQFHLMYDFGCVYQKFAAIRGRASIAKDSEMRIPAADCDLSFARI
jgi:hypothetical protein